MLNLNIKLKKLTNLSCNNNDKGNKEGDVLPIKDLNSSDYMDGKNSACTRVCKYGNEDMFFDIERAWV